MYYLLQVGLVPADVHSPKFLHKLVRLVHQYLHWCPSVWAPQISHPVLTCMSPTHILILSGITYCAWNKISNSVKDYIPSPWQPDSFSWKTHEWRNVSFWVGSRGAGGWSSRPNMYLYTIIQQLETLRKEISLSAYPTKGLRKTVYVGV